jgi:hypothetical protein
VEALYAACRKPVARAVEAAGGSNADGNTFFRVALLQTAGMAPQLPDSLPVFEWLHQLALVHFRDWAAEKGVTPAEDTDADNSPLLPLPDPETRNAFREKIRARRQFNKLDTDCQKVVLALAKDASIGIEDTQNNPETPHACVEQYRNQLGVSPEQWQAPLPAGVVAALTDEHFLRTWSAAESMESKLVMGQTAPSTPENKTIRNAFWVLLLISAGFVLWQYFTAAKSPKMVYDDNFKPPASFVADRLSRMANDSLSIPNETCALLLAEADAAYQQKQYTKAAGILASMTRDSMEDCHSDAFFYLGIVGLHLNEPEASIECFAKIPDLEQFGEEIYWYQALAFVKIAAKNPAKRDIARRAVERARSNTELPERRAQAEKMLQQLEQ